MYRENYLQSMLPDVDAVIYVDADVLFLSPIEELWKHFATMNSSHLAALAPESEDYATNWYRRFARHPFYQPLGVNSGVMLMNLTRMREFGWEKRLGPLLQKYSRDISWGDQDLLNILFSAHPERLLLFPCRWNYRTDHCMYGAYCTAGPPAVIHGSRRAFISESEPAFWGASPGYGAVRARGKPRVQLCRPFQGSTPKEPKDTLWTGVPQAGSPLGRQQHAPSTSLSPTEVRRKES
ncbi:hypothetical protein MRX96_041999 [Rhipicephalus microplus]